jgi:hypothetical protein
LRPRPATTPHQVHEPQAFAAYLERRLEKVMVCQPNRRNKHHVKVERRFYDARIKLKSLNPFTLGVSDY